MQTASFKFSQKARQAPLQQASSIRNDSSWSAGTGREVEDEHSTRFARKKTFGYQLRNWQRLSIVGHNRDM
jgi:hypothetical protein